MASLKRQQIPELKVDCQVSCTTEEKGTALVALLERCSAWSIQELRLHGQVGGKTWEGLAREITSGWQEDPQRPSTYLDNVFTDREVLRRGRRVDLRCVWEKTRWGPGWVVLLEQGGFEHVSFDQGGWQVIEKNIQ